MNKERSFSHFTNIIEQSPTFDRVWNKPAVYKYFQGPPNYWKPDEIDSNVLEKYSPKGITSTRFDKDSIMLYAFSAKLFSDGKGATNENTKLSKLDVELIQSMYPKDTGRTRPWAAFV